MQLKHGQKQEILSEILNSRAKNRTDDEPCIECEWLEMIVWRSGKIISVTPERPARAFFVEKLKNLPGVVEDKKNLTNFDDDFDNAPPILLPGERIDPKDAGNNNEKIDLLKNSRRFKNQRPYITLTSSLQ